jgi:hypothetical protein
VVGALNRIIRLELVGSERSFERSVLVVGIQSFVFNSQQLGCWGVKRWLEKCFNAINSVVGSKSRELPLMASRCVVADEFEGLGRGNSSLNGVSCSNRVEKRSGIIFML